MFNFLLGFLGGYFMFGSSNILDKLKGDLAAKPAPSVGPSVGHAKDAHEISEAPSAKVIEIAKAVEANLPKV